MKLTMKLKLKLTNIEAINLYTKEQVYLLKNSVSEIKNDTDTVDSTITESWLIYSNLNMCLSQRNFQVSLFDQIRKMTTCCRELVKKR